MDNVFGGKLSGGNQIIKFDKKCIPTKEYVVLRVIDKHNDMNLDGILVSENVFANSRLAFGQVIEVGSTAFSEYGLKKDDYVCFDRLATAYQTVPVAVIKYNNIICLTNESNTTFSPLKNMIFVEQEENSVQNVGGILVQNYDKQLNVGTIVAMNVVEDVPYKKGDKIMLTKGADQLQIASVKVRIYKHDMIVCKVEDD